MDIKFKNALSALLGRPKKIPAQAVSLAELNGFWASFSRFGPDPYANEAVRACIRTLAEHSSKANVKVIRHTAGGLENVNLRLQHIIKYRPNIFMNGRDFLYKVRTLLEINNTVFIAIYRDETGQCTSLYPVPTGSYQVLRAGGRLFVRFNFMGKDPSVLAWEDVAILRKDYNSSDIFGDSNKPVLSSLDILNTANEGMANAIKSTANLRGIWKTTKAAVKDDDLKKWKDNFEKDYLGLENASGIAALDGTSDFKPIEQKPFTAAWEYINQLRNDIYRYFGVSEEIILAKNNSVQWQAFYEGRLEGFLLALGLELTNKIFSDRERGFGNEIIFESNRMGAMSMSDKLGLVSMVDRGALTPNEWRQVLNLSPIAGGDKPIRRLDTVPIEEINKDLKNQQTEEENALPN